MTSTPAGSPDSIDLNLGNCVEIIRRRWRPAALVWAGTVAIAVFAAFLQKPSYEAHGRLLFRADRSASILGFGTDKDAPATSPPLTIQSNPLKTQTAVITSIPLVQQTIDALKLRDNKGHPLKPKALINRLKVKELPGADVLELQYRDPDPKRAANIVNELIRQYMAYNIAFSRSDAIATRKFIMEQLPKTEATVRQADAALRGFKERNGITDLEAQTKGLVQNQLSIQDALVKAQTEMAASTARLNDLRQKVGTDAQTAMLWSAVSQSSGVQQALKEYQQTETDLQGLRGKYRDNYPQLVNLQRKQQELRELLQQRVQEVAGAQTRFSPGQLQASQLQIGETGQKVIQDLINTELDRRSLVGRIGQLSESLNTYEAQGTKFPELEQEQRELQRQLDAAQTTYETLLKKLQETQVTENQNMGTAKIIEQAIVPDQASSKSRIILIALGLLGGLVLALLTMAWLELHDRRLKSVHEAKKLFDYKVLGDIPHDQIFEMPLQSSATVALPGAAHGTELSSDPVRSAYYMLQANLRFFSASHLVKVILVTSSVRKEGKSTISANLSLTLSQLGHSVALIDADLHAPTQHTIWRTEQTPGLSDVLLNGIPLQKAMRSLTSTLDLLPAGNLPGHPLPLLNSDSMARLVQSLASRYDYVILDSPPLLVDAEAVTLSKLADGVILVVRPDMVDVASAKAAKSLVDQLRQSVLGIVMNGIQPQVQPIPYN